METVFGWHSTRTGQVLQGRVIRVIRYDAPQLSLKLTEPAMSFDKNRERTDFGVGDIVSLTCGQASLKRAIEGIDPKPGDLIWISLTRFQKISTGVMQVFDARKI